jgi:hypothetical protein
MNEQYKELIEAYVAGDVIAIALVDQCINLVADIGYVRSCDGEELAKADIEYFEVRAEIDEEIDNLVMLFAQFNIKSPLQKHCEDICSCDTEQVFETHECACGGGACGGGGGGGAVILPFPGNVSGE